MPFDLSWVIVAVTGAVWLFIGPKSTKVLSKLKPRYSNYRMMKEKVDKGPGGSAG